MVDVVVKLEMEAVVSELINVGYFLLISESIEGLMNRFWKWKVDFEGKG